MKRNIPIASLSADGIGPRGDKYKTQLEFNASAIKVAIERIRDGRHSLALLALNDALYQSERALGVDAQTTWSA